MFRYLAVAVIAGAGLLAAAPDQVKVESGIVAGTAGLQPGVRAYKGIPFAAPPVGNLRWRAPQPAAHWAGVRPGDHFGPICPGTIDNPQSIYFLDPGPQTVNEDCLYLNVWTAARSASEKRPVMVWIYGGGFEHGSGTEKYYWGDDLAKKGVVLVTFDYRVGVLGFLAHPELTRESDRNASGNYALMDQIAALEWVERNIAAFGGDPKCVTIFGQSAGGASVGQLVASPLAHGLFQRAIGQSGGIGQAQGGRTLADAEKAGVAFAASVGAKSLAELRAKSVDQLRAGQGRFSPIVDGYVMPDSAYAIFKAGKQNDVPIIAGSTANEGGARKMSADAAEVARQARELYGKDADEYLKLFPAATGAQAEASGYAVAAARTAVGQRAWLTLEGQTGKNKGWLYLFSRVPPFPAGAHFLENATDKLGAYHAVDLIYVFDHLYLKNWPWQAADRRVAGDMSSYWVNFATKGDPNGKGLPEWPAFNASNQERMNFGDTVTAEKVRDQAALDFLESHPVAMGRGGR
jgi:para-nitrobenzyl esterase